MTSLRKFSVKKIRKGASGLQLRVRDFVRKLRPERFSWQLRHLLTSVDWPPSPPSTKSRLQVEVSDSEEEQREFIITESSEELQNIHKSSHQTESVVVVEQEDPPEKCREPTPEQLMSSQLAAAPQEEDLGSVSNGSVRPVELPGVGGGLAPPSTSPSPRNKSPVTVQEWVDSLPLSPDDAEVSRGEEEVVPVSQDADDNLTLGAEAGSMCGPLPPAVQVTSCREGSESDSHGSSVESLLEKRKPDPEEVLLSLGFGGKYNSESRIPQRFLQPSKLKGVGFNDFLRHQQEMVQNFETGFCGYRGLSGPSHAMPSVIVAKIMEKLREHERECCSVASPPRASTGTDKNKFSRVARNVLTKIRCVPGSSVLTPDNRAWLDSQGHKSPEISRKRIIIGQQSFTFSRDGDLIESQSPPSSFTDSDSRWTSSTGTPGVQKTEPLDKQTPGFPSIQEDLTEPTLPTSSNPQIIHSFSFPAKHAFANVVTSLLAEKNQESKLSNSSVEVSDEDKQWSRSVGDSGLPSSGRSSRGIDECDSPVNLSDDRPTELVVPSIRVDSHPHSVIPSITVDNHVHSINEAVPGITLDIHLHSINEALPGITVDSNLHSINEAVPSITVGSNLHSINEVVPGITVDSHLHSINKETIQNLHSVPGNPPCSLPVLTEQYEANIRFNKTRELRVGNSLELDLVSEKMQPVEDMKPLNRLISSFPEDCRNINSIDVSNFSTVLALRSDTIEDCKLNEKSDSRPNLAGENDQLALDKISLPSLPKSIKDFKDNQEFSAKSDYNVELSSQSPNLDLDSDLEDPTILNSQPHSSVKTSLIVSERSAAASASPWPSLSSELESVPNLASELESVEPSLGSEFENVPSLASELENVAFEKFMLSSNNETVTDVFRPLGTPNESDTLVAAPVKVIESLDKVIESLEKIMEPLELITESDERLNLAAQTQSDKEKLLHSYEDLKLLISQLLEVGVSLELGSTEQFLSLTINERCELQCRVVRQALSAYEVQLAADSTHYELKCCLGAEVHRLSDLLDTTSDPDKLATLVCQMSELLKHQAELNSQLQDWSQDIQQEPLACHQLCEVVLRRLRALELMVHRNTQALSDLRSHVSQ